MPVKFPHPNPNINHIECAEASQRDVDDSRLLPCPVCGHTTCGWGPDGPLPCEMCSMVIYVRAIYDRTGNLEQVGGQALQDLRAQATAAIQANTDAIAQLRTDATAAITTARNDATAGIASVRADATAGINTNAAAIAQLRTDATTALNTKASNANLTAVDTKVNTLKTRVDNATAFPIP